MSVLGTIVDAGHAGVLGFSGRRQPVVGGLRSKSLGVR